MNVVAYCRVSTNEQDQLNSLETQKSFFQDFCAKNGMNLLYIYSDEGVSGTKTKKRVAFNKMMRDAHTGLFQAILAKDNSRFARNVRDCANAKFTLRDLGIKLIFSDCGMTDQAESSFEGNVRDIFSEGESLKISKRIKFSKHFNAERGRVPNFVFGYDKTNGDYFNLNINENEAETVKMIFKKYTENGDGTLKIAQTLNSMGITTKRDCKWSQNAVARILSNSIYIGKVVNGKYEIVNFPDSKRIKKDEKDHIIVQNDDLKIIDEATFEKAQALLKERSNAFHTGKTRSSNKYLFSTLIKCADCGWSFRRTERTYQNTYVRWVCSARNGHGTDSCENAISIDENDLIEAIQSHFDSILSNKEKFLCDAKKIFLEHHHQHTDAEQKKEEITKKLTELNKQKQKNMMMFSRDLISIEELEQLVQPIKAEIARLEFELRQYSVIFDQKAFDQSVDSVFRDIQNITDIRKLSNAQLKKIIKEIKVSKDGRVQIHLNHLT